MTVRIDSYVSPDSWDDLSMDWNNPQAQDARFVDALCRAIYERYKIFFTLLYPERGRITLPQITPDRRLDYSKLLTIHNATLALVSKFLDINTSVSEMTVEKTANGSWYTGTYNYKYDTLKYWTLKECLASFGDSVLLFPQPHVMDNSTWLKQQYKILNALRYSSIDRSSVSINASSYIHRKSVASDGTVFEETVSEASTGWRSYAYAQVYSSGAKEYETCGFSSGKASIPAALIPRTVKSVIAHYWQGMASTIPIWSYCPIVFTESSFPGYRNIPVDASIPAGSLSFDIASLGDLALISTPSQSDIYKSQDTLWSWGAERNYTIESLVIDNTFNFRNW